jgi:hypothetical protein
MSAFSLRILSGTAALACLLVCGCGGGSPLTKDNYDKIQNGMTPEQVGVLFGFDESFEKLEEGRTVSTKFVTSKLGVDRQTDFPVEDEMIEIYSTKEMGGVNQKEIHVRYREGKVEWKDQLNVVQ